jgi:hypothetical protein
MTGRHSTMSRTLQQPDRLDGELPTTALEADPQGQKPGAAALEGAHPLN